MLKQGDGFSTNNLLFVLPDFEVSNNVEFNFKIL